VSSSGESRPLASGAHEEYVLTKDWPEEQERLHLLESVVDEFSVSALQAAGFRPGLRCLEIGAGSGSMTRWMAQHSGDPGLVTATDLDPRLLAPLKADGIRVLRHDVVVDEFPPESFDVIFTRTVLEHIPQRDAVLARLVPWLAPNGALVIVDCASFPVFSSPNAVYRAAMKAWVDVLALTGTDYEWTRRFPEPLQRHGYRDVEAATMARSVQGGSHEARFWSLTLETLRARIIEAGLLGSADIDEAQRLLADPQFWDVGPAFIAAWGKRP
jgi:SAM-dependent methyltransferase